MRTKQSTSGGVILVQLDKKVDELQDTVDNLSDDVSVLHQINTHRIEIARCEIVMDILSALGQNQTRAYTRIKTNRDKSKRAIARLKLSLHMTI